MNSSPIKVDLLIQSASQTGHSYAEAYTVWEAYSHDPDVYAIVETVLWVAQTHDIPVVDAIKVVSDINEQFGSPAGLN